MTARDVPVGAWVLIRGRVTEARSHDCLVEVASIPNLSPTRFYTPHTELFVPDDPTELYEALRLLSQRLEEIRLVTESVTGRCYEQLAMAPPMIAHMLSQGA
jgi:hypothetical protein